MKVSGFGQAKILTKEELRALFERGLQTPRDRALFAVCYFCACRISEALKLQKNSITESKIIFNKNITKGKLATREIAISSDLQGFLKQYSSVQQLNPYYFPGYKDHLQLVQASRILKAGCKRVEIEGASTHSFRRTALTEMYRAGVPLRTIQAISGHKSLLALQVYLEVDPNDKIKALNKIGFY